MMTREILNQLIHNEAAAFAIVRHYHEWWAEHSNMIRHMSSYLVQLRYLMRQKFLTTRQQLLERSRFQSSIEARIASLTEQANRLLAYLENMLKRNAAEVCSPRPLFIYLTLDLKLLTFVP